MKTRYIILASIAILLGLITVFLPEKNNHIREVPPEEVHTMLLEKTYFLPVLDVAKMLVENHPSIQLIDIRLRNEFEKFHLPGAINIPMDELMNPTSKKIFSNDRVKHVLYGNGTVKATQCWMLLKRLGYNEIYVLQGGLNEWYKSVYLPDLPPGKNISPKEIDDYLLKLALNQYFTGNDSVAVAGVEKLRNYFATHQMMESLPEEEAGDEH